MSVLIASATCHEIIGTDPNRGLGYGRRTLDEIERGDASSQYQARYAERCAKPAGAIGQSRTELSQAQDGGDAGGLRGFFRVCGGEALSRSTAEGAIDRCPATGSVDAQSAELVEMGRGHCGCGRGGRSRLPNGH